MVRTKILIFASVVFLVFKVSTSLSDVILKLRHLQVNIIYSNCKMSEKITVVFDRTPYLTSRNFSSDISNVTSMWQNPQHPLYF